MPTNEYRQHRRRLRALVEPGVPSPVSDAPIPVPPTPPILAGIVLAGPRDARVASGSPGIAPVAPNVFGDFIQAPNTDAFDAVHTYAVVRQTLTM